MPIRDLPASGAHSVDVIRCDRRDQQALYKAIEDAKAFKGGPSVIIADTVRSKISFMEARPRHGKAISDEDFQR